MIFGDCEGRKINLSNQGMCGTCGRRHYITEDTQHCPSHQLGARMVVGFIHAIFNFRRHGELWVAVGRASCQAVVSTHPPTGYASSGLIISRWTHERKCRPRASCRSYHHWPAVEVVAGGTPASRRTTARCRRSKRPSTWLCVCSI